MQLQNTHRSSGNIVQWVAEFEKQKLNECLGRLEAISFELLSAAFTHANIETTEYEVAMEHCCPEMDRLMTPVQPIQSYSIYWSLKCSNPSLIKANI